MSEPIIIYKLEHELLVTYSMHDCTTQSVWGEGTQICLYDDIKDRLIKPSSARWWQFWK